MSSFLLIVAAAVLLVVLIILVVAYLFSQGEAKKSAAAVPARQSSADIVDFEALVAVIADHASTAEALDRASQAIVRDYVHIEPNGPRGIVRYAEVVYLLCSHPNVKKTTILAFDKGLVAANGHYRTELDAALKRGLNARG